MEPNSPTSDSLGGGQEVTSPPWEFSRQGPLGAVGNGHPYLQCWLSASPGERPVPICSLSSTTEGAGGAWIKQGVRQSSHSPAFLPPPLSAEPPTVHVTRHTTQDRSATLRCWALGFYPQDISLSWWLGKQELALETEYVETRPSGDGTYQTWAAVQVPAGQEAAYTCRVQHSGLNHVLTVAWGKALGLARRGQWGQGRSQGPRR